ncbi:ComF family protein [Sedimenticola thiotaurini]|uniref:Double zinc ribbon domain-containing protein n=1 Tax=Sedimenticola thiotaurini TaxID=1543721 RepID=A0A0F7K0L6_9GAMM|nr:ComF family protein [Sedimenticola thiotaurini]AKH20690.1 hypothetical protein AAY24_10350 [Sedimenticola thiotaurini]
MVYSCIKNTLSLLYPDHCQLCDAPATEGLCTPCREDLPYNRHPCPQCGLPLSQPLEVLCGSCQQQPPAVDRSWIPFLYAAPVDRLISQFKFSERLPQGRLLSRLLAEYLTQRIDRPDLLIPVPLHPDRLRQRGYNQALELARPLGRRFGIPLDHRSCQRTLKTRPQHALKRRQRESNIRGAFRVVRPLTVRHVALVDDVVTTGNTVNELARQLKQAGVARVDVWALARTP